MLEVEKRVEMPHPLSSEVGITLALATHLENKSLEDFLGSRVLFYPMLYRCTDRGCGQPTRQYFFCPTGSKLVPKHDVSEGKILPSTLRLWCRKDTHYYTKRKKTPFRCKECQGDLDYFLVGSERTELFVYHVLDFLKRLGNLTTPALQGLCVSKKSTEEVLKYLKDFKFVKENRFPEAYRRIINQPRYWSITKEGVKESERLEAILKRSEVLFEKLKNAKESLIGYLESAELPEDVSRYVVTLDGISVREIPAEIRKGVIVEYESDESFRKVLRNDLGKFAENPKIREWLEKNVPLEYARIPKEIKSEIYDMEPVKYAGLKKALATELRKKNPAVVEWLKNAYKNPGFTLEHKGYFVNFKLPSLKGGKPKFVRHISSGHHREIFAHYHEQVGNRLGWSKVQEVLGLQW